MTIVTKKVPQKDLYNMSHPMDKTLSGKVLDCHIDISKVGGCPSGTWTYPQNASCSTVTKKIGAGLGATKICVQPNPNVCPGFSGKIQPKFTQPIESGGYSKNSVCGIDSLKPPSSGGSCYSNVACSYDIGKFNTADVQGWLSKWGADDGYNTVIMPDFCGKQVTTCPIDPTTKQSMDACSRMVSTWDDGKLCKNWMSANKDLGKTTVLQYCENYNTPDCGCINRDQNDEYVRVKKGVIDGLGMRMDDTCWYMPCSYPYQSGTYLIPPTWTKPECPDVCEQVVKLDNEGKISGDINFKQFIKCDWQNGNGGGNGNGNGNGGGNGNGNGNGGGNGNGKQTFFQKYKKQIIIWSIVVTFIILIFIVAMIFLLN